MPLCRDDLKSRKSMSHAGQVDRIGVTRESNGNGGVWETGGVGSEAIGSLAVGMATLLGTSGLERSGPLEWLLPRERNCTWETEAAVLRNGNFYSLRVRWNELWKQ